MEYLITLVHGTFAPKAPWTQNEEQFCQNLEKELASPVSYQTLEWSGKNRSAARTSAAKALVIELQRQQELYPDKQKIIIAHSHGGNIAMYALRDMPHNNDFKLITMATPFLNASLRAFERSLNIHALHLSEAISGALVLLFVLTPKYIYKFIPWLASFKWYVAISLVLIFIFIGIRFTERFKAWSLNKMLRKCQHIDRSARHRADELLLYKKDANFPMLTLIDYSDEIKLWFRFLYRIWEPLFTIYDFFIRKIRVILFLVMSAMLIKVYIIDDNWGKVPGLSQLVIWSNYGLIYLALPLITLLLILLLNFLKSNIGVLGKETFIEQLLIKTIPSNTPLGYRNLNFIQHNLDRKGFGKLKHGVYEHEIVLEDISIWIKSNS